MVDATDFGHAGPAAGGEEATEAETVAATVVHPTPPVGSEFDEAPATPTVPDFEMIRPLASGGFGTAWLARSLVTGDTRAIKIIERAAHVELAALARIRDLPPHPSIMPVEHVGRTRSVGDAADDEAGAAHGRPYLVMPLADDSGSEGPFRTDAAYAPMTLRVAAARAAWRLDPADFDVVIRALLDGLAHLHAHGVVHGDIKPDNILRLRGHWSIADHGIAVLAGVDQARGATPGYCSDEAPAGTMAGDLHALAATMLRLVSGESLDEPGLWSATDAASLEFAPAAWRPLLRAMLGVPTARYRSAGEVLSDLPEAGRRRWIVPAATAVSVVVLAGAVAFGSGLLDGLGDGARGPGPGPVGAAGPGAISPATVTEFEVRATAIDGTEPRELATAGSAGAFAGDVLKVTARLDRPAGWRLIGIDANGTPETLLQSPPGGSRTITFPEAADAVWEPDPAAGHGAVLLIVAAGEAAPGEAHLADFDAGVWRALIEAGDGPEWTRTAVRWNGQKFLTGTTRGTIRTASLAPPPIIALIERLRSDPATAEVQAAIFPILPSGF